MSSDNSVTIVGNLVDDPELRFTSGGAAMAKLRIAVNRRWRNRQTDQWEEDTSFFSATAWREMAENVAGSLRKGSRVIITGRLQQRQWETPDGDKRSIIEISADEIGPSLRWATAEVQRTPRREGGFDDGQRQQAPAPSPEAAPAPAAVSALPEEQPWADEPAF